MSGRLEDSADRDERLQEILHSYLQAVDAGEAPDREALVRAHPELAAELEAFFADQDRIEQAARAMRPAEATTLGGAGPRADYPTLPPDGPATSAPGTKVRYFGDYELLEEIARGGMGVVYKARQVSLNRIVALKMILAGQLASPDDVLRFRREAEAAANLDHPNIVPIYEVGEHEGQHYFSMKFIEGGSLSATLARRASEGSNVADQKNLALALRARDKGGQRHIAELMVQVARAVHHAHQRGILHRDLKPGNILLDAQGQPHVTDFGLAKRVEGDARMTQSGAIVGTPSYMAPEQARSEKVLTTAVDVYSLGAILYELLTGRPPFRAETPLDTVLQVLEREPEPPHAIDPKIDRDLDTICLKCLEKEPGKRYGSGEALAGDLDRWLNGEPIVARPSTAWERLVKWARRNPTSAALVLVGSIGSVLLMVVLVVSNLLIADEQRRTRQEQERTQEALNSERDARHELSKSHEDLKLALAQEERALYRQSIALAHSEWLSNNVRRVEPVLDSCNPHLRHWEWHYLKRLCHPDLLTIRAEGHLNSVAFSRDGQRLAVGGDDHTVRILDATTGREIHFLKGHTQPVACVAFSPDGKYLGSAGGDDETVRIWDMTGGTEVLRSSEKQRVNSVAFSPDSQKLAWGGSEGIVKIWDMRIRKVVRTIAAPGLLNKWVASVAFSPDGKRLASLGWPKEVNVWDVTSGKRVFTCGGRSASTVFGAYKVLTDHDEKVVFSPDGKRLAAAGVGSDGTEVKVWDAGTGQELLSIRGHSDGARAVAFSPDSKQLASGGGFFHILGEVRLWDARTGQELFTIRGHTARVASVEFSPDGKRLASAAWDGTAKVWDVTKPQEALTNAGIRGALFRLDFSPDGRRFASVSQRWLLPRLGIPSYEVAVWDSTTGREVASAHALSRMPIAFAFTLQGPYLAWLGENNVIKVIDVVSRREVLNVSELDGEVKSLALSLDGQQMAWTRTDKTVKVWSTTTKKERFTLRGHSGDLDIVRFSPDGERLATGGADRIIRIWNARNGEDLLTLSAHAHPVVSIWFSPNGLLMASLSADKDNHGNMTGTNELKIWDALTGKELNSLRGFMIGGGAFSPDSKYFAVSFMQKEIITLQILDISHGKPLCTLSGDPGPYSLYSFTAFAFSPDSDRLVSVGADKAVRLWDAKTGHEIMTLHGHKVALLAAMFSPDGNRLVTAGSDPPLMDGSEVKIWDGTPLDENKGERK
jgi:WD40 repeat protein